MKGIIRIGLSLFLLSAGLTGCTTVAPPAPNTPVAWENRQQGQTSLQSWKLSGKIAVQSARESGSASIDWVQRVKNYQISLLGPLGSNGVKLSGHPGLVTMDTADGKHATASSPEKLLAQQMGWNLPVSHLSYWIRGLPVPGLSATTNKDAYGRLSSLNQDGWDIRYPSYTTLGDIDVPSRVFITSPDLKVKIVVYSWQRI